MSDQHADDVAPTVTCRKCGDRYPLTGPLHVCWGPADDVLMTRPDLPTWPALTKDDLDALPEGTPIIVLWSGGNGPARYTLVRHRGRPFARHHSEPADYIDYEKNLFEFMGIKHPFTRVWIDAAP